MANVVEYTLSLNDWITGKLNKINITNNRALEVWAKVEQRVNSASNTMQKCGVTLGSLRERVDALRAEREWIPASNINAIRRTNIEVKALERQIRQLERVNGGKIKTISVAEEFAQAISAVYHEEPVSTLVGGDFAL